MTPAYSRMYLADAEDCLAGAFDYAVHDCGVAADVFSHAFVRSGLAGQFERGNPSVVAGMSGIELACEALASCGLLDETPQPSYAQGLSPEYWAGWAIAQYQWSRACRFSDVFDRVPPSRIVGLYSPLHEADISVFSDRLDRMLVEGAPSQTNLARLRALHGLSQSQLAKRSGVGLKSIQAYEQRANGINRASGQTLQRLAAALDCSIETLMEFEPRVAVEYLPQ